MLTSTKTKILNTVGLLTAAGAPIGATASQFPIWVQKSGGESLSGAFLLACFLGAIPVISIAWRKRKELKKYLPITPFIMCAVLYAMLTALEPIIPQLKFILWVSMIGQGASLVPFLASMAIKSRDAKRAERNAIESTADIKDALAMLTKSIGVNNNDRA